MVSHSSSAWRHSRSHCTPLRRSQKLPWVRLMSYLPAGISIPDTKCCQSQRLSHPHVNLVLLSKVLMLAPENRLVWKPGRPRCPLASPVLPSTQTWSSLLSPVFVPRCVCLLSSPSQQRGKRLCGICPLPKAPPVRDMFL